MDDIVTTPDLVYRYQMNYRDVNEVLRKDINTLNTFTQVNKILYYIFIFLYKCLQFYPSHVEFSIFIYTVIIVIVAFVSERTVQTTMRGNRCEWFF